ncbi:MAG TPA: hypothetical protein VIV65_03885 [Gemmatimonadaceae bacterium]|jgi:hypothetical protein
MMIRGMALMMLAALGLFAVSAQDGQWTMEFGADRADLGPTGRNRYFVLEPGYTLTLEHGSERLVITALAQTMRVDGVETRIVEERETNAGQLVEISRNYFAISRRTSSVFYFGEDVDMYKNGKVTGHEGSWRSGVGGARFGLAMPAEPLVEGRYYQEIAPKIAMDRARVVSITDTLSTPAGRFASLLVTEETTPLEPGVKEYKRYAPGIGLIQDGDLKLSKRP